MSTLASTSTCHRDMLQAFTRSRLLARLGHVNATIVPYAGQNRLLYTALNTTRLASS